jgi:hypothetical protein
MENATTNKFNAGLFALIGVFILALIGNHATKCTDVLMYDVTLVLILICFLIAVTFMQVARMERETFKQFRDEVIKHDTYS